MKVTVTTRTGEPVVYEDAVDLRTLYAQAYNYIGEYCERVPVPGKYCESVTVHCVDSIHIHYRPSQIDVDES